MTRVRKWLPLLAVIVLAAASTPAPAQREHSVYAEVSATSRYLWRGHNFGTGPTVIPGLGIPYWLTPPIGPQRGFLIDAHGWLALSSRDRRRFQDQLRVRAQFVATSAQETNDSWAFRVGSAGYAFPSRDAKSRYSAELFATAIGPMLFERQNTPFRPYVWVGHDFERFDGTLALLGVRQDKELNGFALELDIEASASDYRSTPNGPARGFSYHATSIELFVGRTPSTVSPGPTPSAPPRSSWRQYGVVLGLLASRGGFSRLRGVFGVRFGMGQDPPWGK